MNTKDSLALIVCLFLAAGASACNLPAQAGAGGPQAWIDAPLTGDTITVGTNVEVTSHSSDLSGITNVELSINKAVLNTANIPEADKTFVLIKQIWTPTEPGVYELQVRAQNTSGQWSDYAVVLVTVGRAPVIVPIQTLPPTLVATAAPSDTATPSPMPTTASTGSVSIERISTNLVYFGAASCGPLEVTITARATAPNGITVVVLFYRFSSNSSSAFQNVEMNSIGGDLFQVTLNPTSLAGASISLDQASLQYQIVVQQIGGDTSLRTTVMSDITLQACGSVTAACSSYTDKRSCQSHGCAWVSKPGIVPIFACKNP